MTTKAGLHLPAFLTCFNTLGKLSESNLNCNWFSRFCTDSVDLLQHLCVNLDLYPLALSTIKDCVHILLCGNNCNV